MRRTVRGLRQGIGRTRKAQEKLAGEVEARLAEQAQAAEGAAQAMEAVEARVGAAEGRLEGIEGRIAGIADESGGERGGG